MIGVSGTFTNLHYPNAAQVPGVRFKFKRWVAFYTHRLSKMHYIGVTYQYHVFSPSGGAERNPCPERFGFLYSLLQTRIFFSLFGGPQYSNTQQLGLPPSQSWSPAGGASFGWQGR